MIVWVVLLNCFFISEIWFSAECDEGSEEVIIW